MNKLKLFFQHCYHAVYYGDWYCGWEMNKDKDKPIFGFSHTYYDGDFIEFQIHKLWIGVSY